MAGGWASLWCVERRGQPRAGIGRQQNGEPTEKAAATTATTARTALRDKATGTEPADGAAAKLVLGQSAAETPD